jgi:hypothetical protein
MNAQRDRIIDSNMQEADQINKEDDLRIQQANLERLAQKK